MKKNLREESRIVDGAGLGKGESIGDSFRLQAAQQHNFLQDGHIQTFFSCASGTFSL
jgi:hypothetical protein